MISLWLSPPPQGPPFDASMTGPQLPVASLKGKEESYGGLCVSTVSNPLLEGAENLVLFLPNIPCQSAPDWVSLTSRVKHNSESERRSPSSEDDRDEKESKAEIQNPEDYKEIFQPKNSIS